MFTTLKRQWRIVTPLVTVLVAVSIVVTAFLVPASAHTKKVFFRYSGDAADFVNYAENPAFFDCFSGYLGPDGSGGTTIDASLDNCTDAGFTSGVPGLNQVSLFADVAAWDVHAFHSKTEGHANATAALVGDGAVNLGTSSDNNCFANFSNNNCLIDFDEVRTTAEAECQSHNNHLSSHAAALSTFSDIELFGDAATGNNANDVDTLVNAFTNIATGGRTVTIVRANPNDTDDTVIFTFNEKITDVGRGFADISANGVHIIDQTADGNIGVNVVLAHTHADIECAFNSFSFEDPIGA